MTSTPCVSDYQRGDENDPRSPDYDDSGDEREAMSQRYGVLETEVEELEEELAYYKVRLRTRGGLIIGDVVEMRKLREVLSSKQSDLNDVDEELLFLPDNEPDCDQVEQHKEAREEHKSEMYLKKHGLW